PFRRSLGPPHRPGRRYHGSEPWRGGGRRPPGKPVGAVWQPGVDQTRAAAQSGARERGHRMVEPRATVCLTFDFDAISLWVGPMGATSPSAISRGEFGVVGVERILRLLDRTGIPATFFVPGHTADTYPEVVRSIARAG